MSSSQSSVDELNPLHVRASTEDSLASSQEPPTPAPPSRPSTRTTTIFKQPFLESFFPPQASSAEINDDDAPPSTSRKRGKKVRKHGGRGNASTAPPVDEENLQTAFVLKDRSLEIYVTLPSAEKRLFVDVQEEVSVPNAQSTAKDDSSHRSKRLKVDDKKPDPNQSLPSGESASAPAPPAAASSSKTASGPASLPSTSKAGSQAKESASKHVLAPLSAKDPNAPTSRAKESKSSAIATLKAPSDATLAETTKSLTPSNKVAKQKSVPRLSYATFDQVKLNVRVKPCTASNKEKSKQSSGITVAALPKKIVHPKVIDRFPIRILGSTTRPTADVGLQDSFDLSVQGCTDISSLLVLLFTRLKMAHPATFYGLELNAIRLWHLDEDRLIRLSIGNIASNNITPKSILCYTIGKRTGKSFVHVYADKAKVGRVEVDVELSSVWQAKEKDESLEESKPHNAPRRQLFKFKQDIPDASATAGNRDGAPNSSFFSLSLLGEPNQTPTPMDIARDQARTEHYERLATKERLRKEREEERIRLLKAFQKKSQKSKKGNVDAGNDSLAANGPAEVHAIPEENNAQQDVHVGITNVTLPSPGDVSEESEWDSDCFNEDWYDANDRPDDDCDEGAPFNPHRDGLRMSESVLFSVAAKHSSANSHNVDGDQALSADNQITTVQDGLEHILTALGIPSSAQAPFIRDMIKTTAVFPYIAVKLVPYETLAFAINIEAKYKPLDEEGVYWDIQDIQQVCLVYKGVWKSEVEDWKKGCQSLLGMDWSTLALCGCIAQSHVSTVAPPSAASSAPIPTTTVAFGSVGVATIGADHAVPPAETTAAAPTTGQRHPAPLLPALTPEQRFTEYRKRTEHRRDRICPNCEARECNLSRHTGSGCDCGECEGVDDVEDDEFFKYYDEELDNSNATTSPASSGTSSAGSTTSSESAGLKETVASVMVPGHRARVVQCIYMEAF